jgi:natural product precursor
MKKIKKLTLNRETLSTLDGERLHGIVGGYIASWMSDCLGCQQETASCMGSICTC